MKTISAKQGDFLDSIWFFHVGSERSLDLMIEANGHLAHKYQLDAGDVVYLPNFTESEKPQDIMRVYGS